MTGLIIALNVIFALIVLAVVVGLHARAVLASRGENAAPVAPVRRTRPRTRPATARPSTAGRLAAVNR